MSEEGKPITPELVFKRFIWRTTLDVGGVLEKSTTWTITGVAAAIGLTIGNAASIGAIVSPAAIRSCLILFAMSLLTGAVSKIAGMALGHMLKTLRELDATLSSEGGQNLMNAMNTDCRSLFEQIADIYPWPMSYFMRRSAERGAQDHSAPDKTMMKFFAAQIVFNLIHILFAFAAIMAFAFSV